MFDRLRRRLAVITTLSDTCAYCDETPRATVLWPGDEIDEPVCFEHARFISQGLAEVCLLIDLRATA